MIKLRNYFTLSYTKTGALFPMSIFLALSEKWLVTKGLCDIMCLITENMYKR